MGLESYQARYTYQLTDWTKRAYDKRNIDYVIVPGEQIDDSEAIVTGQVLDAHGRSYFGMSQMMNLVKMLKAGEITDKDIIFFEDMFQPGMEALPYILMQTPKKYQPQFHPKGYSSSDPNPAQKTDMTGHKYQPTDCLRKRLLSLL